MWRLQRRALAVPVWAALRAASPGGVGGARGRGSSSSSSWCWRCGGALGGGGGASCFCPACRALQPPPPLHGADLFRLMGCPPPRSERSFRLDEAQLQRRFRSLQRRLHPDRFGQSTQAERDFSEQHSALVNRAYGTLRRPLSRGLHLLELNGVELEKGTDSEADPEFLSEIMEINEKLTETNNEDTREELENYIAAKQEELARVVGQAFDQDDLQKAKKALAKMKYFANLEEKVKRTKIPS
uniref:iron-sulfur cluster co-chaperone protein HscB n=1 Tax=Euleptes europaea TaxID=460621 RepID=UPI002540B670|nr:iron-sulfur cluster co-chaperone protein HscB [Euleptes europaea]